MKNLHITALVVLVGLSGCFGKKKDKKVDAKKDVHMNVDIPVAQEEINSFFNDDINEFALSDDMAELSNDIWMDHVVEDYELKTVYFDFGKANIKEDQEDAIAYNVALINSVIEESKFFGDDTELPQVVVSGHSCSSAGSRVYNLSLSEKRAKVLADRLVAEGVPQECIKVVGRGIEVPALIDGVEVDGGRDDQWLNRRDEMRIIFS